MKMVTDKEEPKFEVKELPERYAIMIHRTVSITQLPQTIGECYHLLGDYLAKTGGQMVDVPYTAYHNMDMEHLEVDMGFPTSSLLPGQEGILSETLPAGKVVSGLYRGPYSGMESFYAKMTEWTAAQNLQPTGVFFEFYYNSPQEVPESELLTRIEWPVVPIG